MEKHNSCVNTLAIISYIEKREPNRVEELFYNLGPEMAGIKNPRAFLSDPNNWVSSKLLINLYEKARFILNDNHVAYYIGFNSVREARLGYIKSLLLSAFGNVLNIIKHLQKVNDQFNKTKTIEIVSTTKNSAVVRLLWAKDIPLSRDFCLMNKGIYEAVPLALGLPPGHLKETKCFFEGDDCCEYELSWKQHKLLTLLKYKFFMPTKLSQDAIEEMIDSKELIREKYTQVHGLNLKLQQKIDQLLAIQQTSTAVLSSSNLYEVLDYCLSGLLAVAGLKRAGILLVEEPGDSLKLIHAVGVDKKYLDKLKGYNVPFDKQDNIIARAAEKKQPVFINDTSTMKLNPNNPLLKIFKPKSFILVPLIVKDEVKGMLIGDCPEDYKFIEKIDREFLKIFANQMAVIIEKIGLYEELESSELKYRNIVENAHDGIWLINEEGQITYNNRRAEEILGKKELIGRNIYDLLDQKGKKKVVRILRENLDNRLAREEVDLLGDESQIIKVMLSSVPLVAGASYGGSLMMATDLTEKSRMEAKLLQAQKLESVGRMAGGIAHDFNNLLTGIIGNAQLLQVKMKDETSKEYHHLDVILKTSGRAAELVSDLLSFSRGTQSGSNETTQANYIVKDTFSLLQSSMAKNINLKSNLTKNLPPIQCGSTNLQQIITNLVLNARDAMSKGGDIVISTSLVILEANFSAILRQGQTVIPGEYVRLTVSDQGSGIDPRMQDKVFDPFYTTKEVGKGTGLGLAMVYGIITACGGCLNIQSEINQGTIFELYFPIADRRSIKRKRETEDKSRLSGNETILVVDDEPFVRDLALDILSPAGYQVMLAKDGVEALHVYKAYKDTIDLILLDLVMPKMNGKKVFEKVREINENQKIIVCSGYDTEEYYAQELIGKGAVFTKKPFKMYGLLKTIRETLTPVDKLII
jgi:PAS domain S-box-containing protein